MLATGPRFAEHHRRGGMAGGLAVPADPLAVGLHLQLLQEGGQQAQPLGIGDHRPGAAAQAVAVVEVRQGQERRRIAVQGRRGEVRVHRRAAGEEAGERVPAQADGAGQSHRRPHRITAAHPVAEREDPLGGHAERPGGVGIGGDGHQMPVGLGAQGRSQPVAGGLGVGQGLLGGEGLGDGDHQGLGRIQAVQGLGDLEAVDIAGEAQLERLIQRTQCLPDQPGPQVRAADADMHHRAERPSLGADDLPRPHIPGKGGHRRAAGFDLARDGDALGLEVRAVGRPQRRMQGGAVLGPVDRLARE